MTNIKFLDLHSQYCSLKTEIQAAINEVIQSSAYIGGPFVKQFEQEFANFQKARHCIGVGNGTDALEIAFRALNLTPGSEVIVPANTFIASSEAVTANGLKVVFCDVNPQNYTIDIADLRAKVSARTSAIVAVHLYGHPCDMDSIMDIAKAHNLRVVEDCAQAHGAEYKNMRVGTLGDLGTFSFYPGKNLGAYGDGGAIVTNDETLAEKCRRIANHGRVAKYDHIHEGRCSRLDGLQAAILAVKLQHLETWTNHRIKLADLYSTHLSGIAGLDIPVRSPWARQVYHLFVVRCTRRDELAAHLKASGIETGIHYPIALPMLAAYEYLNQQNNAPFACGSASTLLSLPIGEHLSESDILTVIHHIAEFMRQ